jgi:type II secretory pathway component PulF
MSALSTETLPPELHAVRSAVHRLLAPAPLAEKRAHDVAASMGNGGSLSEGLAQAGVAVEVSEALALAAPLHPALAIDALVPALARREARRRQLRSAGFYPAIVAMSTLVVAWLFSVDVIPQLDRVRHVIGGTPDPTPLSVSPLAIAPLAPSASE